MIDSPSVRPLPAEGVSPFIILSTSSTVQVYLIPYLTGVVDETGVIFVNVSLHIVSLTAVIEGFGSNQSSTSSYVLQPDPTGMLRVHLRT